MQTFREYMLATELTSPSHVYHGTHYAFVCALAVCRFLVVVIIVMCKGGRFANVFCKISQIRKFIGPSANVAICGFEICRDCASCGYDPFFWGGGLKLPQIRRYIIFPLPASAVQSAGDSNSCPNKAL